MQSLLRVSNAIDAFNTFVGRWLSWLVVVAVALIPRYGAEGAVAARLAASVAVAAAAGGYLLVQRGRAREIAVEALEP